MLPATPRMPTGVGHLSDMDRDGRQELFSRKLGLYRRVGQEWKPLSQFTKVPNLPGLDVQDSKTMKFVDLTDDETADLLVAEGSGNDEDCLIWLKSLGDE